VLIAEMTASWPRNAAVSSFVVYSLETAITGTSDENRADEDLRVRIVMLNEGSDKRAARIGAPTDPVAPAISTLRMVEDIFCVSGTKMSMQQLYGRAVLSYT